MLSITGDVKPHVLENGSISIPQPRCMSRTGSAAAR